MVVFFISFQVFDSYQLTLSHATTKVKQSVETKAKSKSESIFTNSEQPK